MIAKIVIPVNMLAATEAQYNAVCARAQADLIYACPRIRASTRGFSPPMRTQIPAVLRKYYKTAGIAPF